MLIWFPPTVKKIFQVFSSTLGLFLFNLIISITFTVKSAKKKKKKWFHWIFYFITKKINHRFIIKLMLANSSWSVLLPTLKFIPLGKYLIIITFSKYNYIGNQTIGIVPPIKLLQNGFPYFEWLLILSFSLRRDLRSGNKLGTALNRSKPVLKEWKIKVRGKMSLRGRKLWFKKWII